MRRWPVVFGGVLFVALTTCAASLVLASYGGGKAAKADAASNKADGNGASNKKDAAADNIAVVCLSAVMASGGLGMALHGVRWRRMKRTSKTAYTAVIVRTVGMRRRREIANPAIIAFPSRRERLRPTVAFSQKAGERRELRRAA